MRYMFVSCEQAHLHWVNAIERVSWLRSRVLREGNEAEPFASSVLIARNPKQMCLSTGNVILINIVNVSRFA